MRIYYNCTDAINDIGRELKKCATTVHTQTYQNKVIKDDPAFITKEIQAYQFMILDTKDKDKMPGVTLEWAKAEFKERIDPDFLNPGEAYKLRPEIWNEFINDEGRFDYTYSDRIKPQLQFVINELRDKPETRQAIIEVHNNWIDVYVMGKRRIPCSLLYQFMIRDGKLDLIYIMRSSDFATHFQNDIWLADELRNHIAASLMIPPGKFIMFVSSLHCYKKDWDTLKNY